MTTPSDGELGILEAALTAVQPLNAKALGDASKDSPTIKAMLGRGWLEQAGRGKYVIATGGREELRRQRPDVYERVERVRLEQSLRSTLQAVLESGGTKKPKAVLPDLQRARALGFVEETGKDRWRLTSRGTTEHRSRLPLTDLLAGLEQDLAALRGRLDGIQDEIQEGLRLSGLDAHAALAEAIRSSALQSVEALGRHVARIASAAALPEQLEWMRALEARCQDLERKATAKLEAESLRLDHLEGQLTEIRAEHREVASQLSDLATRRFPRGDSAPQVNGVMSPPSSFEVEERLLELCRRRTRDNKVAPIPHLYAALQQELPQIERPLFDQTLRTLSARLKLSKASSPSEVGGIDIDGSYFYFVMGLRDESRS